MAEMNPLRVVLCGFVPNRLTTLTTLATLFLLAGCSEHAVPPPVEGGDVGSGEESDESSSGPGPGATGQAGSTSGADSTGQAASPSSSGSSDSSDSSDSSGCDPTPVFDIVTGLCRVCDKIVKSALVCEQECEPGDPCWCDEDCGPCFEGCEADAAGCWCDGEIAPAEYCEESTCECALNPSLACFCGPNEAPGSECGCAFDPTTNTCECPGIGPVGFELCGCALDRFGECYCDGLDFPVDAC